jgi:hypothetical protein
MTCVKINGEELEVSIEAPGATLAEAANTALTLHRKVCAGMAQRERHAIKRVVKISGGPTQFGFVPDEAPEDDTE